MTHVAGASTRKSWADLCRVVAIFGVVVIHACGETFNQFGKVPEADWLSANLLDSLVRCSVPLFVMLSGALLLNKEAESVTLDKIFPRVIKVAIPLLFWNIAYLLYISHFTGKSIIWLSMLREPPMYHLWFVYMIIGLYILLPLLQTIFQVLVNRRNIKMYFVVLWFVITCVPIYQPLPLLSLIQQTNLLGYGGYFLIGGIIAAATEVKNRYIPLWITTYFIAVAITFELTWYLSEQASKVVDAPYLNFSPNVFFSSIAAFVVLTKSKVEGGASKILHWISDRSFLVFFMHVVVLERVHNRIAAINISMPTFLQIIVVSIVTFLICLIVASILRLLPKSRAILG